MTFVAFPRGPRYAAVGFSAVLVIGAIWAAVALGEQTRSQFTAFQASEFARWKKVIEVGRITAD